MNVGDDSAYHCVVPCRCDIGEAIWNKPGTILHHFKWTAYCDLPFDQQSRVNELRDLGMAQNERLEQVYEVYGRTVRRQQVVARAKVTHGKSDAQIAVRLPYAEPVDNTTNEPLTDDDMPF